MKDKRLAEIYKILEQKGEITVEYLSEQLAVSEATIRRDLQSMEELRMIVRFYGGARIADDQIKEPSLSVRNLYNLDIKKRLAIFAASLIKEGDIVYIDAGTTTSQIVDYIRVKNILIITQAINVFEKLLEKNIRCFVASGYLKKNTGLIIGTETIEQMNKLKFNIAFLGGNSVHSAYGFSASEDMEASLKNAIIKNSATTYVVADSSKINKLTVPKFAALDECNLITDSLVPDFNYNEIPTVYYFDDNQFKKLLK